MGLAGFFVGFAEEGCFFEFFLFAEFAFGLDGEEFFAGAVEETQFARFVDAERVEAGSQFDGGESVARGVFGYGCVGGVGVGERAGSGEVKAVGG